MKVRFPLGAGVRLVSSSIYVGFCVCVLEPARSGQANSSPLMEAEGSIPNRCCGSFQPLEIVALCDTEFSEDVSLVEIMFPVFIAGQVELS